MGKMGQMRGNSSDLENLKTFLNLQLGKVPQADPKQSILGRMLASGKLTSEASPEAVIFAKQHDLYMVKTMIELQTKLRSHLQHLVDPESIIPIRAPKDIRRRVKRIIVDKYLVNPQQTLGVLLRDMNRAAITSKWRLRGAEGKSANLHLRDRQWLLWKTEFNTKDKIYSWLARILEHDEVSILGCCRTCQKWFLRNRAWQCSCSSKCKKVYDNALSAERKAARAAKQEVKKTRDEINALFRILSKQDFRRRLPGGPSEKARTQEGLLKQLNNSVSTKEFLQHCSPTVRNIIDTIRER